MKTPRLLLALLLLALPGLATHTPDPLPKGSFFFTWSNNDGGDSWVLPYAITIRRASAVLGGATVAGVGIGNAYTWQVTDGTTASTCTLALTCAAAAGAVASCVPSNVNRAAGETLTFSQSFTGPCTINPTFSNLRIMLEYSLQ